MLDRLREPVVRGFVLAAIASAAFGFAMNAQQNIVSNFFEHELGLQGPEFGYITAIREIPGFLLIFLTALFYRVSLPRLTAGALCLLAIGYGLFGTATSFWTVAPWVIISSMGYHTFLQTQYALGMSLTTEARSGSILGKLGAIQSGGAVAAMAVVFLGFEGGILTFNRTYVLCGLMALVAAIAIVGFPHLRDGEVQVRAATRDPIVLRREYKYYYLLSLLDGGRQQIFFSFGLWVLVHRYALGVPTISAVLLCVTALSMLAGPWIGRMLDRHGERRMLALVNSGYVVALFGYALVDNVAFAVLCYVIYSFIMPLSGMGAATYLRKVAVADEIAPSLAMGVTMQHVAAVVVPVATGFVLNYVGYQVPFLIGAGFACLTFAVTRRLSPETQKSPRRLAQEERLRAAAA
ncbi:MAG TPA: MFS transporter [Chloroflexota bacterium]|jgi:predicted MFS family arabinose efflux permease